MLFSLVMAVFCVILLFFMPFLLWKAFSKGYNLRAQENGEPQIRREKSFFQGGKIASKEEKRRLERNNRIIANIDNYDGTPKGQKEVEAL